MTFLLQAAAHPFRFRLAAGTRALLGREDGMDCQVPLPGISRRHAALEVRPDGVGVVDTGSAGGVWIGGARVASGVVRPGETVRFADVEFRLTADEAAATPPGAAAPVPSETERRLTHLLDVAVALTRVSGHALLDQVAASSFDLFNADRCTLLLRAADGELSPAISRDRRGAAAPTNVPRSITTRVVEERVAIRTDDAGVDSRFRTGVSVMQQQVRSVMVAPLLASDRAVLGVLYVDNFLSAHLFTDADLGLLEAFAGIAAAAIENSQLAEQVRRQAVAQSNFERFFAPQVAARIAGAPEASRLGGERRQVAVLFSDIRGFTALSEQLPPDTMATWLSEYFTEMVECVFRHGGTLDKFIGDALMAQWGAPWGDPQDADHALAAAVDMLQALETLNARWRADGRPLLRVGIGLSFGEVFAGNIGSERRLEFTVIGDTVNTASRLCSAAGPGEILLSGAFHAALTRAPEVVALPPMALKGKQQAVEVYRLGG